MEISLTWIVQEIGLNQQIDMHFPKLRSRKVQYLDGEVAKELKCRKKFRSKVAFLKYFPELGGLGVTKVTTHIV